MKHTKATATLFALCLILCVAPFAVAQTARTPLNLSGGFNLDAIVGPAEYRACLTDGGHDLAELFGDRPEGVGNYIVDLNVYMVADGYGPPLAYSIDSTYGHPIYVTGDQGLPADGVLTGADRAYHVASLLGNTTLAGDWTETADPSDFSQRPNCLTVGAYHNKADWQVPTVTVELNADQKGAYQDVNFILCVHNGAHLGRNIRIVALYGADGTDEAELYAFTTAAGGEGPIMPAAATAGFRTVYTMTQRYAVSTGVTGGLRAGEANLFEFDAPLPLNPAKALWGFRFEDVNPALNWAARGLNIFAATATRPIASNAPPVADAGADRTIVDNDENGSESVQLNGAASTDSDGMIVTFAWTEDGAPLAVGVSPTVMLTVASHAITLTVTDDAGATATDTVVMDVTPVPPGAPVADAGADQAVADLDDSGDELVDLDGSGSYDPDGTIVSYSWTEDDAEIAATATAQVVEAVGVHDITLTVTDNEDRVRTDTVTITVTAYRAPITYYVNATTGSDANDGSETAPWATIQNAAAMGRSGDTVIVRPGVYDEKVTVHQSGAAGALLTFRAEPSRQAQVKGFVLEADYVSVEGFEITNTAAGAIGIHAGEAHRGDARTGCRMINNFIHDIDGQCILTGENAIARGNLMRNIGNGFLVNSGSLVEDNEIDGLMVVLNNPDDLNDARNAKYAFFAGDNITFRGNYWHGTPMTYMATMSCCFFGSWDSWIWGSSHNILIENNVCFGATHASEPSADALLDSSHITYRNNLFADTVYVGVLCRQWSNITVVNNTFINCGAYPVWFQKYRETIGSVVRNNLIAYWNHNPLPGHKEAESGVANYVLYNNPEATVDCDYNMFWGCLNRGYGANDFDAEPIFVDPAGCDFRLAAGSPGIDAGFLTAAPETDMLGVLRPQGAGVDVGAWEFASADTPGDADRDGDVDLDDFVILKINFGSTAASWAEADFDGDGDVDLDDFVILKNNFGS